MKFRNMVVSVPVQMHVRYWAEPGKKSALMKDIERTVNEFLYECTSGGINGVFSIRRMVRGKHK